MPGGRRRRLSSSSAETVDERGIRWQEETAVLKQRPDNIDSDNWPIFELHDAVVYEKKSGRMANALEVMLKGPFLVRGSVDASSKVQEKRFVRPTTKPVYIQIRNSPRYCIGDEPQPVVWVEGDAGWYEIQPHADYAAIYEKSCEGIRLYYIIMALYEKAIGKNTTAKQRKRIVANYDLDELFFQYALAIGDGVVRDEVIARCDAHAAFLLDQFPQEGDFEWADTSFFKWMQSRHTDLQAQIGGKTTQKPVVEQDDASDESSDVEIDVSERRTTRASRSQDVEMADAIREPLSLRTKSRAKSTTTEGTPQPPPAEGASAMLLDVFEEIGREYDPTAPRAKLSTVASKIYYKCKIRDKHAVDEIIIYFANDLVRGLSPLWQGTVTYTELEARARSPRKVPRLIDIDDIPNQLRRRVKYRTSKQGQPEDSDSHSRGSARTKPELPSHSVGRLSGKAARLRLASTSRKRYREEMDVGEEGEDEAEAESGLDKKTKTSHFFEAGEEEQAEEEEEEDEGDDSVGTAPRKGGVAEDFDDEDTSNDDVEVDSEVESGDKLVQHIVTSHPLPSTKPMGPNGAWVCQELACRYMIRAAETKEGQAQILEHIRSHGDEDSKVKLALEEGQRNRATTSHLIEKLRAAGTSSLEQERRYINKKEVPLPVQRHPMFNI